MPQDHQGQHRATGRLRECSQSNLQSMLTEPPSTLVTLQYLQLLTAALFFTWTTAFTIVKYTVGYVPVPTLGYWPMPPQVWPPEYSKLIRPLYACLIGAFVTSGEL